ncbi:proline rich protein 5MeD [Poronia punctata]|nr:proline rich protein 5MeD [Poronia punctata]
MGYNIFDHYLYASNLARGVVSLIKIGGTGNTSSVGTIPAPAPNVNWNAGDVDVSGYYWASANGTKWILIDVNPSRTSTYGKVVATGKSDPKGFTPIDWAYVPGGGNYLWALGHNANYTRTQLMRFDRTLHTWTLETDFGSVAGQNAWGAVYAGASNTIIASENVSGETWSFPLPSTGLKRGTKLSRGPASNNNDGTRCPLAL